MLAYMSELCDYGNIVVDIDTITVLSTRARLVSTIKIKSVYPLQPFQRYFIFILYGVFTYYNVYQPPTQLYCYS